MTGTHTLRYPQLQPKDRIIAALDVATAVEARELVDELRGHVGAFKVGSRLFTAAGPDLVRDITASGERVFLDLKFHDIPNTVARAAVEAARLGVWMLNVHCLGGSRMMRQTADQVRAACEGEGLAQPLIIGVTVLTSSGGDELREVGIDDEIDGEVVRLARLAAESRLDGVVASAREAPLIRQAVNRPNFLIVTPGIRPVAATNDDQKRVTTFKQAIESGSDLVVIGRPVLEAADKKEFLRQMVAEVETT